MTESSHRIAIVLPTLGGGGAERVNVNLANQFVSLGLAVDIVLMRAEGELMSQLDPRVRVVNLGATRIRGLHWPLVRYLREVRPQVLLACMWPVTVVAMVARLVARVPVRMVFSEHTNWSIAEIARRPRTRLSIKVTMRLLYRCADASIAVSKGAARELERMAWLRQGSVVAIYNPIVDDSKPSPATPPVMPEGWVSGSHKRVLAVGTLKSIKDYPTLLRAFERVSSTLDARLLILGEGSERDSLEGMIRDLGLDGRVFMPGFVVDPAQYMALADLHVLSSTGEGFGNVIVEALEHGVPVVSTDCPSGPREILCDGEFGKLVTPGDAAALATAMLQSLGEAPDREALKARARDFSVGPIADQYLEVLLPSGWSG